jgi:HAD superfamily hydrolase (TIGR01549 family)
MPIHISRIRAIFFDVDGTLSDTDDLFVQKLEQFLHPIRFLIPNRDPRQIARRFVMWSEAPGNYLIGIPDTLGVDDKIALVLKRFNRHSSLRRQEFLLVPGVLAMLQVLSVRYPLAVISVRDESSTRLFLDQFGLTSFFQVIVTGQTTRYTKPHPDPILYAAQALAVPVESCLMVGDTTVDIRAGKVAGAQTVGVLCGFGEASELRRAGADLLLDSTADLVQVLEDAGSGT